MLIVHLLSFKWDHAAPFPALKTLAKRMGITPSSVRAHLRSLGKKGYLVREINVGKTNRFHLQPLFRALESLMSADRIEAARASEGEGIKVELISHELGMGKIVGQVTFSSLPVNRPKDFSCEPSGILSFDAAKAVSEMITANLATGEVGEIIWRLC
jgi:hypothetical protein